MSGIVKELIIVCPLVFIAGFIDSAAGGGGLISLPAYIAAGIPVHVATGTNKCSSALGTIFSAWNFFKNGKVHIKSAICSSAAALIGSYIGAMLNMIVDEYALRIVMIAAVPIVAVFVVFKRDFGDEDKSGEKTTLKIMILSSVIGLVIGCYDGFFGPGTGTFLIFAFTIIIGFDMLTASGNAKFVNLSSNIAALIAYTVNGNVIWRIGIPAAAFCIAGNILGSRMAIKKGSKFIKPMFLIILAILFVKIFMG